MTNKDEIKKLNDALLYGDKAEIARKVGISKGAVNDFFKGKENKLKQDTQDEIMIAGLTIINDRIERRNTIASKLTLLR